MAGSANESNAFLPLDLRRVRDLADGGAPSRGQRLAIEFANTTYAVRGEPREGIGTPEHLAAWLRDHADQLTTVGTGAALLRLTPQDVETFLGLRNKIRALCGAAVDQEPAPPTALVVLNEAAAAAPRWPQIATSDVGFTAQEHTDAHWTDAVRAEIARDAISTMTGPDWERLRRCQGPGCVLYFVKDHHRREWCSTQCGTRARVARHYQRHKRA